jgi:hypothetical protein
MVGRGASLRGCKTLAWRHGAQFGQECLQFILLGLGLNGEDAVSDLLIKLFGIKPKCLEQANAWLLPVENTLAVACMAASFEYLH